MEELAEQLPEPCTRSTLVPNGPEGMLHPDGVTSVIQHDVRAGTEAQYETWLKHITAIAPRFLGHIGMNIIRPHEGREYFCHSHRHRWPDDIRDHAALHTPGGGVALPLETRQHYPGEQETVSTY